jgi:hypothetical protein
VGTRQDQRSGIATAKGILKERMKFNIREYVSPHRGRMGWHSAVLFVTADVQRQLVLVESEMRAG